ncbi:DUF5641 domain-containing protein [Trichonephila clavipes]|nr:DUF5641 domain-containing protein [Trichonephila clavipes]
MDSSAGPESSQKHQLADLLSGFSDVFSSVPGSCLLKGRVSKKDGSLVLPLTNLTKKNTPKDIPWESLAEDSFVKLKEELVKMPSLHTPDLFRPFLLFIDASATAIGAYFAKHNDHMEEMSIALLSKKLTLSQMKWSTIEREAFSVLEALQQQDKEGNKTSTNAGILTVSDYSRDRYILTDSYVKVMLLGYADASESAYGAVVYMHSVKEDGTTTTKLIGSKSRVAPIKVISIPRLELSACLLLAQLVEKVHLSLQVNLAKVILHTDSTIAIAWINTPANQLKTFVGNRVFKIQTLDGEF